VFNTIEFTDWEIQVKGRHKNIAVQLSSSMLSEYKLALNELKSK